MIIICHGHVVKLLHLDFTDRIARLNKESPVRHIPPLHLRLKTFDPIDHLWFVGFTNRVERSVGNIIFLSHASEQSFEAELLQFAYESLLGDVNAKIWTYKRDQARDEKAVAQQLKTQVKKAKALVFLVSTSTLEKGAAQWMELAYADAYNVPTFVLLQQLAYSDLKARDKGVPPLLLSAECNSADRWREIVTDLRECCSGSYRAQADRGKA